MNAKMMIAGLALVAGLGAAVPAHADSLQFGIHGRRFGIGVGIGYPAPVYAAPAPYYAAPAPYYAAPAPYYAAPAPYYAAPAPYYAAPAPYYVAPGPAVVVGPTIVGGGYYGGYYGGGGRAFYRGRGGHFRR